eukprot:366421-Chlamydomonas_euryale.AAC.8
MPFAPLTLIPHSCSFPTHAHAPLTRMPHAHIRVLAAVLAQGLAACLPVVGAQFELPHSNSLTADASADAASPTATLAAAAAAAAAAGHGGTASPERVSPAKVAHQLPARAAASAVERAAMVSAAQAAADRVAGLEYARSIGIYRGEELSW